MITDGIHTDITIEDYHNKYVSHLSSTQIKLARKSLSLFDWTRRGLIVNESKPHFDFGNAFELALLNPVEYSEMVAVAEDAQWIAVANQVKKWDKPRSSGVYQQARKEFLEANTGKYIIEDTDYEKIKCMLESCMKDKIIQGLIKNIECQLSLFWTDPETGLKLKTRPDICKRKKNVVVNLKTIEDGSPQAFSRDLAKFDYPLQAAIEITGCIASGLMEKVDNYFWLVVEKEAPFNATIYEFDQSDIEYQMDELRFLLNKISRAQKENLFPGYSDRAANEYGILKAEIPMWYKSALV
jgi:hypothetical protein